jgi:hypothetical protein
VNQAEEEHMRKICVGESFGRSKVGRRPAKKMTDAVKLFILNTVVEEPHLYLPRLI